MLMRHRPTRISKEKDVKELAQAATDGQKDSDSTENVQSPWYSASWYEMPWYSFLMRRRKKDWNEILRLNDHNTLDYVE